MEPQRIVVVKLNKLGDSLAFLPTLSGIRNNWREARITLITTGIANELFSGLELADRIRLAEVQEVRTFSGFIRLLRELRRNNFGIAVASSDSSSFVALLFFLAGIPRRIGFSNSRLSFLYNEKIHSPEALTHHESNLLILKTLGLAWNENEPLFEIPDPDKAAVSRILRGSGIKEADKFAVLHCGSKSLASGKLWPAENFAKIVGFIFREYALKTVFIGEKEEDDYAASIAKSVEPGYFIDLGGRTAVKEMLQLISRAGLFIGHPSGPLQAAYLLGTPSVSLWGASSFDDWRPVRNKGRHICLRAGIDCLGCEQNPCLEPSFKCMELISVAMVEKAISRILEKKDQNAG